MALNPFKDSNLNDLQQDLLDFFYDHTRGIKKAIADWWVRFNKKGNERITVMFIPHNEKKIVNFHISIFAISIFVAALVLTVSVTSVLIVNHTSNIKSVSKLKMYGSNSKVQIQQYKVEINRLYEIFQRFKPEITYLYSLTPGNTVDSMWAKGGVSNPNNTAIAGEDQPAIEILNIEEMERDLRETKNALDKIKVFLADRKKIIENTPSLWPVNGYIISRYGERVSPYSFKKEVYRGIDIAAFPGAEIVSTAPGNVESIQWDPVLGLTVSIKHKYGFVTSYSHCQRVSVEVGQKINKGEVIGYVGRTGKAIRHLCYYQIRIGTEFVDPMPYLNKIIVSE